MSQQPAPVAGVTASSRIWTVPNAISFVRLLGVPLFLYLLLGPQHDGAAVAVLAIGGTTDWVDGYVARRLGQVSRVGELLDPFADRLYILAALIGLTVRDVVPWWLTAALLLREAVLAVALLVLRRHGYGPPPVNYVGKTGTFVLLFAFPVLLLAKAVPDIASVVSPIGWGLAWWALGLYWAAAVLYLAQTVALLRADRAATRPPGGPVSGTPVPPGPVSGGAASTGPVSGTPAPPGPVSGGAASTGPVSGTPAPPGPAPDGRASNRGPALDGPVGRRASGEPRAEGPAADGAGMVTG
jgi:cardiolipin synthase